jgi:signal transduction histidine kinase
MQALDAAIVASEAAVYLQRLAQSRSVTLTLATLPAVVKADGSALFVLLRNLVENAIHHAPPGSRVDLVVNAGAVTVRDYGSGIAEEALPLLFKRFWRGAHRRDIGAGLGLSICEEIARAHGWRLQAANANPGAVFTVHMTALAGAGR